MMKHLFWYPWIMAALVTGILVCMALIAYMLFFQPEPEFISPGAHFVMEGLHHALA